MSIKASSFQKFLNEGMKDEMQGFFMGRFCVWVTGLCLGTGSLAKRVAKALIPIDVNFFGVQTNKKIYNG